MAILIPSPKNNGARIKIFTQAYANAAEPMLRKLHQANRAGLIKGIVTENAYTRASAGVIEHVGFVVCLEVLTKGCEQAVCWTLPLQTNGEPTPFPGQCSYTKTLAAEGITGEFYKGYSYWFNQLVHLYATACTEYGGHAALAD